MIKINPIMSSDMNYKLEGSCCWFHPIVNEKFYRVYFVEQTTEVKEEKPRPDSDTMKLRKEGTVLVRTVHCFCDTETPIYWHLP